MRIYTFLKIVLPCIGVLVLVYIGWARVTHPAVMNGETSELTIPSGFSARAITGLLQTHNILLRPRTFLAYVTVSGVRDDLKAGTYTLHRGMAVRELTNILVQGTNIDTIHRVTIREGWTSDDIATFMRNEGFVMDGFERIVKNGDITVLPDVLQKGKPASATLEGFLFPDTYEFYRDATSEDVVAKILLNWSSEKTNAVQTALSNATLSFYEVVTLASIVEREVQTPEDRRIVAGIFRKRLADAYPLESDATINYITKKNTTRPSSDDLAIASAYNTYRNSGLPPSPICNPGIDAVDAVLHSTPSEYYFFLTTPAPENTVVYSRTYQEHLTQKAYYYSD